MQNVCVGYVHGDRITQEFHHSLMRTFIFDLLRERRILNFFPQYSGTQISGARNQMAREFLDQDGAEWLWILDSDAMFDADLLYGLLADADPQDYPIVGALTSRVRLTGETGRFGAPAREIVPVVFQQIKDGEGNWVGYREMTSYGQGLVEVDATGCHCLLVHRAVFEKIDTTHPHRWFRESVINGNLAGEDVTFCLAARDAGFPIYVDTTLEAGHVKPFTMTVGGI